MMIRKNDYYKLGAFIVIGTIMVVAVVVILGAGRYFSTTFKVESYFNESVNGLEVGSPVKLRGVKIGRVSSINFVANKYEGAAKSDARHVLVSCDIYPSTFRDMTYPEFISAMKVEVDHGLRVRPTSLGLTGQLFLNFVYTDPKANPPMEIQWTPNEAYVPSVPSTLGRLEGAIAGISSTLSGIKEEDISGIISDFRSIMNTLEELINTDGGKEAANHLLNILKEVDTLLARVNVILSDPNLERIIPEAASAVAGVNRIISSSEEDIIRAASEANLAMASLKETTDILGKTLGDPRMDDALTEIAPMLENVAKASDDLTNAIAKIHSFANRLNGVVASEEANIHRILQDTREVMENLRELSGDAKRYPSGVFFGQPPNKPTPDPSKTEQ